MSYIILFHANKTDFNTWLVVNWLRAIRVPAPDRSESRLIDRRFSMIKRLGRNPNWLLHIWTEKSVYIIKKYSIVCTCPVFNQMDFFHPPPPINPGSPPCVQCSPHNLLILNSPHLTANHWLMYGGGDIRPCSVWSNQITTAMGEGVRLGMVPFSEIFRDETWNGLPFCETLHTQLPLALYSFQSTQSERVMQC